MDEGGKEVGMTVGRYSLTVNGSPSSSTPIVAISRDFDLGEFGAMVDGIMVLVELLFETGDVGKRVVVLLGVPPDGIVDFCIFAVGVVVVIAECFSVGLVVGYLLVGLLVGLVGKGLLVGFLVVRAVGDDVESWEGRLCVFSTWFLLYASRIW